MHGSRRSPGYANGFYSASHGAYRWGSAVRGARRDSANKEEGEEEAEKVESETRWLQLDEVEKQKKMMKKEKETKKA